MTPAESIALIIKDLGYEFEPPINGDPNAYLLNEEDIITLCEQIWNQAVRMSATKGYNYGKGVVTEEAILDIQI